MFLFSSPQKHLAKKICVAQLTWSVAFLISDYLFFQQRAKNYFPAGEAETTKEAL